MTRKVLREMEVGRVVVGPHGIGPDDIRIRRPLIVRVTLVLVGTILLLGGLIGLLLPIVPGWLMIIPGLAILGTEFVWARRLLDTAKAKASDLKAKVQTPKKPSKVA